MHLHKHKQSREL